MARLMAGTLNVEAHRNTLEILCDETFLFAKVKFYLQFVSLN